MLCLASAGLNNYGTKVFVKKNKTLLIITKNGDIYYCFSENHNYICIEISTKLMKTVLDVSMTHIIIFLTVR